MGDESRFVFDLNRIKYSEIMGVKEGDPEAVNKTVEIMARSCVKWPLEGEPTKEKLLDMGLTDFVEMQVAFNAVMDAMFQQLKGNK